VRVFHTPDEEYQSCFPFQWKDFERDEKAFHIVDPASARSTSRLESVGIDVARRDKARQFRAAQLADAYLRRRPLR